MCQQSLKQPKCNARNWRRKDKVETAKNALIYRNNKEISTLVDGSQQLQTRNTTTQTMHTTWCCCDSKNWMCFETDGEKIKSKKAKKSIDGAETKQKRLNISRWRSYTNTTMVSEGKRDGQHHDYVQVLNKANVMLEINAKKIENTKNALNDDRQLQLTNNNDVLKW